MRCLCFGFVLFVLLLELVRGSPVTHSRSERVRRNAPQLVRHPIHIAPETSGFALLQPHQAVPAQRSAAQGRQDTRQFFGGFMRMFEQAEWDVIFIKMTRVLVNYFTDMSFKMVFGQTGRSLDQGNAHRTFELLPESIRKRLEHRKVL